MTSTRDADEYRVQGGAEWIRPRTWSFHTIKVLQHIWGDRWDDRALNIVDGLCPTHIEVIEGNTVTCDSRPGRIRVFLRPDGETINWMELEAPVGVRGGNAPKPTAIVNSRALDRLKLERPE